MIPPFRKTLEKLRSSRSRSRRTVQRQTMSPRIVRTEDLEVRSLLSSVTVAGLRDAAKQLTNSSRPFDEFPAEIRRADAHRGTWTLGTAAGSGDQIVATKNLVHGPNWVAPQGITANLKTNTYSFNGGVMYLNNEDSSVNLFQLRMPNSTFRRHVPGQGNFIYDAFIITGEIPNSQSGFVTKVMPLAKATPQTIREAIEEKLKNVSAFKDADVQVERSVNDGVLSGAGASTFWWRNIPGIKGFHDFTIRITGANWDTHPFDVKVQVGAEANFYGSHRDGHTLPRIGYHRLTTAETVRTGGATGMVTGQGNQITRITDPNTVPLVNAPGFTVEKIETAARSSQVKLRGTLATPAVDGQFTPTSAFNVDGRNVSGSRSSKGLRVIDIGSDYVLNANRGPTGAARDISAFEMSGLTFSLADGERFVLRASDTPQDRLYFESKADSVLATTEFEGGTLTFRFMRDGNTPAVRVDLAGGGEVTPSGRFEFVGANIGGAAFDPAKGVTGALTKVVFTKETDQIGQLNVRPVTPISAAFDGDPNTPFTYDETTPAGQRFPTSWADFQVTPAAGASAPAELEITTSNEDSAFDPTRLKLYARKQTSGNWDTLADLTLDLPTARGQSKLFPINTSEEYLQFRFEFQGRRRPFGSPTTTSIGGIALKRHEGVSLQLSNAEVVGAQRSGSAIAEDLLNTQQNLAVDQIHVPMDFSARTASGVKQFATIQSTFSQRNDVKLTLDDFAAALQTELRKLVTSGTTINLPRDVAELSATRRADIASRITVTPLLQTSSNPPAFLLVKNSPVDVILSMGGRVRNKSYNGIVASPVRMTIPSGNISISGQGELQSIRDLAVSKIEIGESILKSDGTYQTQYEELRQQGSGLKLAFFKRNSYDGNNLLVVPGNSFGLYGDKVPFEIPAVNNVQLGATGKYADLGDATNPGLIVTNGQFYSLSTPIPSVVVDGRSFTSKSTGSTRGLRLARYPRLGNNERSFAVIGGASLPGAGTLISTDLHVALGATGSSGLVLFPDTNRYTLDANIAGQFLVGSGILAQSAGAKFAEQNGNLVLSGRAFLDLNAAAAHSVAEVTAGTAKPKGQLVRGRFSLDYPTNLPANQLSGTTLNWFISDPTVKDKRNQTLNIEGYAFSGRSQSQSPLRLTIGSTTETLQGSFSTAAGGGILTGVMNPATLTRGKLPSTPLILDLASLPGEPSGFLVNGVKMEDGMTVTLAKEMDLQFAKASFNDAILADSQRAPSPAPADITSPQDTIVAVGGSSPANQGVIGAIDNMTASKYVNNGGAGTGLEVTPAAGSTVVTQLAIKTSSGSSANDPSSYKLEGKTAGGTYALISEGPISLPSARHAWSPTLSFANSTAYTTYRLTFPTLKGSGPLQLSELLIIGRPASGGGTGAASAVSARVRGQQLLGGSITSPAPRTVGDFKFDSLTAALDVSTTPTAWRIRGQADYFGTKFNVGLPGAGNPQMTIGGSAGQQLRVTGIPDLAPKPGFLPPPVIRVAGLALEIAQLQIKGAIIDNGSSKTYTYTSTDYEVNVGGSEIAMNLEVTFTVSASGVRIDSLTGTLTTNKEFKIGNATVAVTSLTVSYDINNKELSISGNATLKFKAAGADVDAEIDVTDFKISSGTVQSFSASITGSFELMKLSIQANSLTVTYDKSASEITIEGDMTVSTQEQGGVRVLDNLTVTLGGGGKPGIVIQGGTLQNLDFTINGDINLFKMTASPKDLRVNYSRASNQLQITGELEVTLAPNLTVTAGLPGEGLLINTSTGKVQVRGLSLKADSDIRFGVLQINGLAIEYVEESNGNVSISAEAEIELPSGLTVGGSFKIVNGKLDSIGIVFERNPGILVAKGLINIYRIDVKVEGLSDLNNFRIIGEVSATVGPRVKFAGQAFAYADIVGTIEITPTRLTLKGEAQYVGGLYGSGSFEGSLDWSGTTTVSFKGQASLYGGLVQGNISARVDLNGNIDFNGSMQVAVPDKIPVIGGQSLGQLGIEMRIRPSQAPSASYIKFSIRAGLGPVTLHGAVTLDFGGTAHYEFGGSLHIPLPWPLPDINISKSFKGKFKVFDGTQPVIMVLAANAIAGTPDGEIVYEVQTTLPENTTVDLYVDRDNMGNDGVLIASGIPYQAGPQTFKWEDMSTFAGPGDPLYVYAVVSDGQNANGYSDYSSRFEVTPGFTPGVTHPASVKSEFGDVIEFSTAAGRPILVTDPRSATHPNSRLEVVLQTGKGFLDLSMVPPNVEYTGEGTEELILTGTAADITQALDGLLYFSDPTSGAEPDAVEISVRALPQEISSAVTGKIDITFNSVALFVNGGQQNQQPVDVVAGAHGQKPLDMIEVQSYRSAFITGAQVKINNYETGKEFLALSSNAAFYAGVEATFSVKRGVLTLTGEGRVDDYVYALSQVVYETMGSGSKSVEISLLDQSGAKNKLTVPVNILPAVVPPKLDVGITGTMFVQGDLPIQLAVAAVDIPDGESIQEMRFDFDGESFVVGEDALLFDLADFNSNTGSNLAAQYDSMTGSLVLTGTATENNWNVALQEVQYQSLGGTNGVMLSEGPRYVRISVTDATGNTTYRHVVVDVTMAGHTNPAPELTLSRDMVFFEPHDNMLVLDGNLTLTSDAPKLIDAKVSILSGYNEGEFELAVGQSWPGIISEWDPMAGVLRIHGVATTWEYEDILRSVKVVSLLGRRFPGDMNLSFTVNDGLSATESEPISVIVETAPFLQADLNSITDYTKGQEQVRINDGFWIDTDDVLKEARVSIGSGYRKGQDELIYDPSALAGALIQGDWDADTGVLTLTGAATPLDYEEAFRGVYYKNSRHNPVAGDRVITYQVETSVANSNALNAIISVNPEIIPPAVTMGQIGEFTEDGGAVTVIPNIDFSTMDTDSPFGAAQPMLYSAEVYVKNWVPTEDVLTFTESGGISGMLDAGAGRLVLTGAASFDAYETVLKSIQYNNTSQVPDTTARDFTVKVEASAGAKPGEGVAMLKVNAVNETVTQTAGTVDAVTTISNSNPVSLGLEDVQYSADQTPASSELFFQATQLPDELIGRIIDSNGTPLEVNDAQPINLLNSLRFEPATGGMGSSTFAYKVVVGDATSGRYETDGASQSVDMTVEGVATTTASQAFVAQAYRDLLHANPDSAKLEALATVLDGAKADIGRLTGPADEVEARRQTVDSIITGNDYRAAEITSLYQGRLGRTPSAEELAVTTELATLRRELLASNDYFLQNNSDGFRSYIRAVFQLMLEREPTDSELTLNQQKLEAGVSRADFVADLNAPEISEAQRQTIFQELLGRAATFDDTFDFDASTKETLLASILSSDEYYARYSSPTNSNRIRTRVTTGFEAVGVVGDTTGGIATGTLIAPQYALVAAHTVADLPPGQITFTIGANTQHIEKRYVHPDFDRSAAGTDGGNDIAILKLMSPVTGVTPATLTGAAPKLGEVLNLVGYGQHGGALFGIKREGSTPPVGNVTETIFSWTQESATQNDADPGDSGAPLFGDNNGTPTIIGIVSGGTGNPGEIGDTGINTRIDAYVAWIQTITGDLGVTDASDAASIMFERESLTVDMNPGEIRIPFTVSGATDATYDIRSTDSNAFETLSVDEDGSGNGELVLNPERNRLGQIQITVTVTTPTGSATSKKLDLTIAEPGGIPTLTSDSRGTDPQRHFTWTNVPGFNRYEIEIANSNDPDAAPVQQTVDGVDWQPGEDLPLGTHTVRVRTIGENDERGAWSRPQTIVVATPVSIDAVEQYSSNTRPTISWKPVNGAARYELWMNNLTTGEFRVIHRTDITSNSLPLDADLKGGLHVFWVRAFDTNDVPAAWSGGVSLHVLPQATVRYQSSFSRRPTLSWTGQTGFDTYDIFVRGRSGDVVESGVSDTSWTPPTDLAAEPQRWWIRGVTADGKKGAWSLAARIDVTGKPVVDEPGTVSSSRPELTWGKVDGASRYDAYLALADGTLIYRATDLTDAKLTPPALADSDYALWLRAFDADGNAGPWSKRTDFTVHAATSSLTISFVDPPIVTVSSQPRLEWTNSGAAAYDLFLRHEDGTEVMAKVFGTAWRAADPMSPGTWVWAVRAVDADGANGSWTHLQSMTIGGRSSLQPVNNATFGQPVTFEWSRVHGVSHYELYVADSNGDVVLRENRLTGMSFTTNAALPADNYRAWIRVVSEDTPSLSGWSFAAAFEVAEAEHNDSELLDEALIAMAETGF